MPENHIVYYLTKGEYQSLSKSKKIFSAPYSPYLTIEVTHYFNENSFQGYICNWGQRSIPVYITEQNKRVSGIIQDYERRENGVFTPDGIVFFKILRFSSQVAGNDNILFTFQYLNPSNFEISDTAFMVMPFGNRQLSAFYVKNIKDFLATSSLQIQVYRSDDFSGSDVIADTIFSEIQKAEFVICDITDCNKNVFFEIGYARGLDKNIIFIVEKGKASSFFDVDHIRRIEYRYEAEETFQLQLKKTIEAIRKSSDSGV